jgi:hypothetical protein
MCPPSLLSTAAVAAEAGISAGGQLAARSAADAEEPSEALCLTPSVARVVRPTH